MVSTIQYTPPYDNNIGGDVAFESGYTSGSAGGDDHIRTLVADQTIVEGAAESAQAQYHCQLCNVYITSAAHVKSVRAALVCFRL